MLIDLISSAIAFATTNLDDLGLLMLWFSAATSRLQVGRIVLGQYLGLALLVLVSLTGWIGGQWFAQGLRPEWLGWLGCLPIGIGLKALIAQFQRRQQDCVDEDELLTLKGPGWQQIIQVAMVTIANGGDNLGIYIPFFSNQTAAQLGRTLLLFGGLVAVWCWLALWVVRRPRIEALIQRYGDRVVPIGLIALGLYIWISQRSWLVWGFN
ncbi:MAG: hypothetical protein RLZZ511_244 [Cyanobacteriota bacterium]|jgi:cadmium resistance protein CadD (predicted permease)